MATTKATKTDLKKLAQTLVDLSVMEVNQLGQILKDEYQIEPNLAVATAPAAESANTEAATETKSQFDVLLKEIGEKKVAVIKTLKDLTGMALGEAKVLIESAPKKIAEKIDQAQAEEMKTKLEEAGAVVDLV